MWKNSFTIIEFLAKARKAGRIFKVAKGAISYGRIFLINMIETHLEYLDKHITNSIEGSYKESMIYRRLIRLKVVILVTDYP